MLSLHEGGRFSLRRAISIFNSEGWMTPVLSGIAVVLLCVFDGVSRV